MIELIPTEFERGETLGEQLQTPSFPNVIQPIRQQPPQPPNSNNEVVEVPERRITRDDSDIFFTTTSELHTHYSEMLKQMETETFKLSPDNAENERLILYEELGYRDGKLEIMDKKLDKSKKEKIDLDAKVKSLSMEIKILKIEKEGIMNENKMYREGMNKFCVSCVGKAKTQEGINKKYMNQFGELKIKKLKNNELAMKKDIEIQQGIISTLQDDILALKKENKELKDENKKLKSRIEELEKKDYDGRFVNMETMYNSLQSNMNARFEKLERNERKRSRDDDFYDEGRDNKKQKKD